LSRTTLRPLGPSVTLTALARMSMPRSILSRASEENLTSLAGIVFSGLSFGCARPVGARGVSCVFGVAWGGGGSGGLPLGHGLLDHAHDVGLLHDQEFIAVELDLGAGPLAEQHPVADLHVDRDELAGLVAPARADGDDLALLRLFLRRVGNNDPAGGLLFGVDALDDDTVVKRTELHRILLSYWMSSVFGLAVGREKKLPLPSRPRPK